MHSGMMAAGEPRLRDPRLNMKKKLTIYIAVAGSYLLLIMTAGMIMDPDMYGVDYADKLMAPCLSHPFGTDFMGRDMLWRSVKGLSNSIVIGLAASAVSSVIALVLGVMSALAGGKTDRVISWCVDCCMEYLTLSC